MWLGSLPYRMELAKKLSPLNYVRPGIPPIIQVHGDKDTAVPYEQAVRLHEALDQAGVANQLVEIQGAGHCCDGWTREENLRGQEAVLKFFQKHGVL
jgi:dipeptidyl aminopeptidase/acylaminoacyl peptidase